MRLLSLRELKTDKGIPLAKSTLYTLITAGKFPKPVKLGSHENSRIAFIESEVDAYIAQCANERVQ